MSDNPLKHYAILFADIVGSTRLYETLGDSIAKHLITDLENEIARVAQEAGGHIVEIVGDEVLCRFDDANTAAVGACRIQEATEIYSVTKSTDMQVRIGLHYGSAILDGGRMFGDSVNVAARVASIAQARQIIMTEQVVSGLSGELKKLARQFDVVRVKGKKEAIVIFDLLWSKTNVTSLHPLRTTPATGYFELHLNFDNTKYVINSDVDNFKIGRTAENDLVVPVDSASRSHAKITFTRGKFVLADKSTNGTYVLTADEQSIYLRREEFPLLGSGSICLGEPVSENSRLIRYATYSS